MLNFETWSAQEIGELSVDFEKCGYRACDYSVGCTYIWKNYFNYEFARCGGFVVVRGMMAGFSFYLCPIGAGDISAIISELKKETLAKNKPLIFSVVPKDKLVEITAGAKFSSIISERDWCDYIYLAEDLKNLSGKKYHGQKNQINTFYKTYSAEWQEITIANIPRVLRFLQHLGVKENEREEIRAYEKSRIPELLQHFFELKQTGGFLTVDGKIVAVSVGEVIGDTLMVHVEKADRDYRGAYTAICNAFVTYAVDTFHVTLVNREDDLGMEGLRKAKTDLHPIEILEKPNVTLSERQEKLVGWNKISEECEL